MLASPRRVMHSLESAVGKRSNRDVPMRLYSSPEI